MGMKHRKLLGSAIRQYRKLAGGMTQPELSERAGLDQAAISRIENGKQGVSDEQMVSIASALGIHVYELWAAVEQARSVAEDNPRYPIRQISDLRSVPLIGWVQAGTWTEADTPFFSGQVEEFVATNAKVSKRAFALEIHGESMINPRGEPSFPPKSRIIVEPAATAHSGSLVIVQIDGETETTFKKLVHEGSRTYLVPLNPQFQTIEIDRDTRICGVVITKAEQQLQEGEWQ